MSYKTKEEVRLDIEFHKSAKQKLQEAYLAIAEGGAQSYSIGTRTVTKHDLPKVSAEIAGHNKAINELYAELKGKGRRMVAGIVPMDW